MKEMKHDSSTLAWSAMGDEWFELAQTGESRIHFIMGWEIVRVQWWGLRRIAKQFL